MSYVAHSNPMFSANVSSSLLTTLGLRAVPGERIPNHAALLLLGNWFYAYGVLSTRVAKTKLGEWHRILSQDQDLIFLSGIDNNVAPREDLQTLGEAAVKAGKIDRRTLNKLKRQEASHANAVEGFAFFAAAILTATFAGVPSDTINAIGIWYSFSRISHSLCYTYIESNPWSYLRSVAWWSGNISCITALVLASKKL